MDAQAQDEEFAVGCILSIKTTLGEEFQDQVIAFDRPSNLWKITRGSEIWGGAKEEY
ncbi:hypothetical protein PHJA_002098500 [Phtheirospermum japonicum]|uniref:LSM12 LSM domain-containing protein n=1 Tax=Phtheirospermum japonicum TaxID=374723 RepID=A0A830CTN3_9LAMI|nr:hypothetical protein PHJA_002098500 [Phtheirospermum japonicum]